jgi:hypothetical protein
VAENWDKLSFKDTVTPIDAITSKIDSGISAATTILGIQKTVLQTISLLMTDFVDANSLLIKTALKAIQTILDKYTDTVATVHLLIVPIRKKVPYKISSTFAGPQLEDSWLLDDSAGAAQTRRNMEKALRIIAEANQGNEGFARTVIESLQDEGDLNRPEYDEEDAVFAVVVLAGAKNIVSILELLQALQAVLGFRMKRSKMIPDTIMATPQDLRATPVAVPNSQRLGVSLEWKNPPVLQTLAEFDGASVKVKEIAILRSTNDEAVKATHWENFFTSQPSELTESDGTGKDDTLKSLDDETVLIRQMRYFQPINVYVDDDKDLEKNTDYYYTVAFRYAVSDPPSTDGQITYTTQNYHQLSNVVKVRYQDEAPTTVDSVQPNWYAMTSPLDLIPDLRFYFQLVNTYVESFLSATTGAATALKSYIDFIASEITRLQNLQKSIVNRLKRIASTLGAITSGVYVTTIALDKGGNTGFMQELATRLSDKTDTSAPPYFQHGYTAGFVLLAGAPNPANLESVKTLVSLLLGSSGTKTPFEEAIDTIDNTLRTLEDQTFGDDLQEGGTPSTSTAKTTEYKTFGDDMEPVTADSSDANVPFDP